MKAGKLTHMQTPMGFGPIVVSIATQYAHGRTGFQQGHCKAESETIMKTFMFYWSPEGRKVDTIKAKDGKEARKEFKRRHKDTFGKYMGEVYQIESPDNGGGWEHSKTQPATWTK